MYCPQVTKNTMEAVAFDRGGPSVATPTAPSTSSNGLLVGTLKAHNRHRHSRCRLPCQCGSAIVPIIPNAHHDHPLEETTVCESIFFTEVSMRSCFTSHDTVILPYIVATCIDPKFPASYFIDLGSRILKLNRLWLILEK